MPPVLALLLVAIFASSLAACGQDCPSMQGEELEPFVLMPAEHSSRAVAIVVHGLNTKPEKMDTIASALQQASVDVFRVALTGHRNDCEVLKTVNHKLWLQDMREAYQVARARANTLGVPLYFVGYSLGSLVNLDLMSQDSGITYDKMVLFAPPVSLRWYSPLIKFLYIFGDSFVVVSKSPESYRANPGTPVAAYRALFDLLGSLEQNRFAHINVPSMVFVDPDDELVSASGIADVAKANHLGAWQIEHVSTRSGTLGYHHLIIDDVALGQAEWARVKQLMLSHLGLI